jgi:hypothetical protein
MLKKLAAISSSLVLTASAWGYGMGQSMYPMMPEGKLIGAEVTGVTSNGKGMGVQGRYTHKINPQAVADIGLGISGGDRDSRIFAGFDYELFPDYGNQPRVSMKIQLENAKEFDSRRNILSLAPMVSKGFSFWGTEAYPFIALPFGVNLNDEASTYQTQMNVSFGATGNIPFDGYRKYIASIEGTIDLKDSYTGVFLGFGYPL